MLVGFGCRRQDHVRVCAGQEVGNLLGVLLRIARVAVVQIGISAVLDAISAGRGSAATDIYQY